MTGKRKKQRINDLLRHLFIFHKLPCCAGMEHELYFMHMHACMQMPWWFLAKRGQPARERVTSTETESDTLGSGVSCIPPALLLQVTELFGKKLSQLLCT